MYPLLEINKSKIRSNIETISNLCKKLDIKLTGVTKGCDALREINDLLIEEGIQSIASSRIYHLKAYKDKTIESMLLRLPMLDEIEDVIQYVDVSLNSEMLALEALNKEAIKHKKLHKVLLMVDLGDLREGCWNEKELLDLALFAESSQGLHLYGLACNLSCYGSVKPTIKNMNKLVEAAEAVEKHIQRKLEIISGGATSTIPLLVNNQLPKRINHLRVGESILLGRDLSEFYECVLPLENDTFVLKAQLIELKEKPSYPIGEKVVDAFGNSPLYKDHGIQKRGILAIGKQDFGSHDKLIPRDNNVKLIGSSSDHLIVDLTLTDYQLGDIVSFEMYYQSMLYLCLSNDITKSFVL